MAITSDGEGNISEDPLFADPNGRDYHLKSSHGRFWPEHDVWVIDNCDSPCIDAGMPGVFPKRERMPNGGRINMGAYGGTPHASMSEWPLRGDINHDGRVNMMDMAILAAEWLESFPWTASEVTDAEIVGPLDGAVIQAPAGNSQYQNQAFSY